MAVVPDFVLGNVTLTTGSAAFTTTGAALVTNGIVAGDQITRFGLSLTIDTITGENSGTLIDVCPTLPAGVSGNPTQLRIRKQADGSRVAAQARNLINAIGDMVDRFIKATATVASKIVLYEGTNNGANKTTLKTADALAADRTFTLPDADVTMAAFTAQYLPAASAAAVRDALAAGGVLRVQVFTSSTTYTPHAKMVCGAAIGLGGGGGGGGVSGLASYSFSAASGAGGGVALKFFTAADIGASKSVTIGAAGAAPAAGNNAGGTGGDTSLAGLLVAKGGTGGSGFGGSAPSGPAGGVAGTGDVTGTGQRGNPGYVWAVGQENPVPGANSVLGGGGIANATGGADGVYAGGAASGYGAGGGAAHGRNSTGSAAGGAGTAGILIIIEVCSS